VTSGFIEIYREEYGDTGKYRYVGVYGRLEMLEFAGFP
jgi:hypothetical protein